MRHILEHIHGGFLDQYQIEKTGPNKYLLVCQDEQTRDSVVEEGPYLVPFLDMQFTLQTWLATDGMVYRPHQYEAWIKLVDAPHVHVQH